MSVKFIGKNLEGFIGAAEWSATAPILGAAHRQIEQRNGAGNDFLGWLDLPGIRDKEEHERVKTAAKKIIDTCDILIVIGIGGSYLGARSAIEFLHSPNYNALCKKTPQVVFAGNTISGEALEEVLAMCEDKSVCVNVISKSGTTTEPAIAFRVLKSYLEKRYGKDGAKDRIFATTDKSRGALRKLADEEGYETFIVPDDVGGRYSVLTPVGLLPIAATGVDIDAIMAGAAAGKEKFSVLNLDTNDSYRYAVARNIMYNKGRTTEIFASYEPSLTYFAEWWKQLFGESEGKDGKGIFPASVVFSCDLHSMGQYIQDGLRNIFETVIKVKTPKGAITIPEDKGSADGLSFLEGKEFNYVNATALSGTVLAHNDGGVPVGLIEINDRSPQTYGELVYFYMNACAASGYMLGVNPFDQPGVEGYKNNMYALLGKPGYEERRAELEKRL